MATLSASPNRNRLSTPDRKPVPTSESQTPRSARSHASSVSKSPPLTVETARRSDSRRSVKTNSSRASRPKSGAPPKDDAPSSVRSVPPATDGEDLTNEPDFDGEVETNNDLPSQEDLRAIEDYTVLDRDGKTRPFKSLYSGHNVARRVLLIFIRHFFCGNCQEYLRTLSASITPDALLGLPVSTFIAVVGCGSHKLIDAYVKETQCPFPVYADPTCRLYQHLGMVRTLSLGPRPAYLRDKSFAHMMVSGIIQGLKQVPTGLVMKMGDQRQVGGEFLFEPASKTLQTPIASPRLGVKERSEEGEEEEEEEEASVEEKCVTWCHRMRTTRDHAEIPELMEILGLEGNGVDMPPVKDAKKWEQVLRARKGSGVSMASQMGRMSIDAKSRVPVRE